MVSVRNSGTDGYRQIRCGLQVTAPSGAALPSFGSAKTQDQSNVYDPGVCVALGENNTVGDPIECAQPHAFAMHCLPAHPGDEIAADVLYGERQRIWDQAENRRHAQKALLELLIG